MDIFYIEKIINALLEIAKAIDESRDTTNLIRQANEIVSEYVKNQNELKEVIEKLVSKLKNNKISQELYEKSLRLLFDVYKDNIAFADGLNYIVNKEL